VSEDNQENTAVIEPPVQVRPRQQKKAVARRKPKKAPRYHVILWNDNDHSFEYVEMMMLELFGFPIERGFQIAWRVDKTGRAVCLTTSKEHAELKVEQIHAYGADPTIPRCKGSMSASLEQVDD
jgi:ATP-dependent Clp protease adaptor protein ClpS